MDSTSKQIDTSYNVPSSSSTPRWNVFLSFRGADTRRNFTSHLYSALDRAGIRTFMDDPGLPRGEDISSGLLKAIQESKICIVVFSKNYASSTWCLTELVNILECKRTMKHLVLPIFYNIHPSEVRNQIGSFAEAFEEHNKRFVADTDKVDMWRVALTEAGNLSGYHIDENGHETKIIQDIVGKVLLEVNPRFLNVAKHPVGIKSRVKHIYPLLSVGSNSVRRIGIYGMGGVGKSTLAKAVYNEIIHCFEGTCFIENVREISKQTNGLISLQKQLVWDILKIHQNISNVDEGISLIEQRLRSKKILIVLDDVDHRSQAYSLAGDWNRFAPGSRIIITTRDMGVLNQIGVDEKYKIEGLEKDESLLLFIWHAFRKPTPLENYEKISEDIVHYTAGLPLALEVLGSYLYTRTLEEWRGSFKKLQQIPRNEIREKLIVSFDALGGGSLKDIFLDIACFFIGMDRFEAVSILDSCGYDSENEIIILAERCLLSVNDKNELRMHDLLRDMGREIVDNMFPDEPEKRSRLWSTGDICNVLKNGKGTEAIQGIIPGSPYTRELQKVPLNTGTFERMHRLRLLNINSVNLTGDFEHIFEELRWLSWHNCPLRCLPSDFHPQRLVILDLRYSKFSILWQGILFLEQLKILNLSRCEFLKTTPDFTGVPCMEKLFLGGCKSLVEVHPSIGSLGSLVNLDLWGSENLRILPSSICNLSTLECFDLRGCSNLEALPTELGNIESLRVFKASKIAVKKLPDSIGRLSKLSNLDLSYCRNLRTLPSSICNLKVLECLHLYGCSTLEGVPEELGNSWY